MCCLFSGTKELGEYKLSQVFLEVVLIISERLRGVI